MYNMSFNSSFSKTSLTICRPFSLPISGGRTSKSLSPRQKALNVSEIETRPMNYLSRKKKGKKQGHCKVEHIPLALSLALCDQLLIIFLLESTLTDRIERNLKICCHQINQISSVIKHQDYLSLGRKWFNNDLAKTRPFL